MSVNRTTTNPILTTKNHTEMKKLLVILILLVHYSVMLILFPIDIVFIVLQKGMEFLSNVLERVCWYYEDYVLKPSGRVCEYALQIMRSDKIIKQMKEASNKLKQGKPIE